MIYQILIILKNNKYKVYLNNNKEDLNGLYQELFSSNKYIFLKEFKVSNLAGTINPLTQEKITQDQYVQTFNYFFNKSNEFKSI